MERAAVYGLRAFLYKFVSRSVTDRVADPASIYMWIAFFYGLYDLSPILLALASDTFLGCYKAIVVFGFTFVFGLALIVLMSSPLTGLVSALAIFIVAISAGGLMQLLVTFGGGQFHPKSQTASGSRFFSLVYAISALGAVMGVVVAVSVWSDGYGDFFKVLLSIACMALAGWVSFLAGSWLYVNRCVHPSRTLRVLSLAWSCVRQRSFAKNMASNGGEYPDQQVRDLQLVARQMPVFFCLIPLYGGQLQILTTLRRMRTKFRTREAPTVEWFVAAEPAAMLLATLLLNEVIYPLLKRKRNVVVTHLTRLVLAAGIIAMGFVFCIFFQRRLQTSVALTSIRWTLVPIVLFSVGQLLVTSSGLELSWSHAPDSLKSVSVALFSSIYALGSLLALALFAACRTPFAKGDSMPSPSSEFDGPEVYFAVNAGLCGLSLVGLLSLRSFYARTREMKIEREIEQRAIEIALARLESSS